MTEPVIIGHGTNKWVKDSNTKLITLHFPANSGTLSYHDDDNVDYQVPVGKKFVILEITCSGNSPSSGTRGIIVSKSGTTDVAGTEIYRSYGGQYKYQSSSYSSMTSMEPVQNANVYIEIPASQYIVANSSSATSSITGIETNV